MGAKPRWRRDRKSQSVSPEARYRRAKARVPKLQQKLIDFVLSGRFQTELDRAWRRFSTSPRAFWALPAGDPRAISFLDWFIHDHRLADGRHPLDIYLAEHGSDLSPIDRSLLTEWQAARFGIYEVETIYPDEGVRARDLFTGDVFDVRDATLARQTLRWDLFAGRIVTVAGVPELSGTGAIIPRWVRQDLTDLAEREFAAYRAEHPEATWPAFFRDRSFLFNRFIEDLARRPIPPLVTAEGDAVCFAEAEYGVVDAAAVSRVLDEQFDLITRPAAGGAVYAWTGAPMAPSDQPPDRRGAFVVEAQIVGKDEPRLNLGTVAVAADRLILECLSRERLARGRALLEGALGAAIVHRADRFRSIEEALVRASDQTSHRELAEGVLADATDEVARQNLARSYEAWLDQPLAALGGQTPRQAAHIPECRPVLEALLRDLENGEERKRRQGRPAYDIDRLRRQLGLLAAGEDPMASPDQQAQAEAAIQPVLAIFDALLAQDPRGAERYLAPGQPAAVALDLFGVEGLAFSSGLHLPSTGFGVQRGEFGGDDIRLELVRPVQGPTPFDLLMTARLVQIDGTWRLADLVPWGFDQSCGDDLPPDPDLADLLTGDAQLNLRPGVDLDDVERIFLTTAGRIGLNYLEQVSAIRIWRDYRSIAAWHDGQPAAWAAAIHFIVVQLGYIDQPVADLVAAYGVDPFVLQDRARWIERALQIGQLDERYTLPSAITTLIRTTDFRPPVLGLPLGATPNGKRSDD